VTEDEKRAHIDHGKLVSGLVLITLGVLFLLDRFDVADFGDVIRHYWPSFIIIMGVSKLTRRELFWSGLWLVIVGTWLQLVTSRLFGLTYANSWPLILMALGAGIILRTLVESARSPREPNAP
jgi:hypothetical protein